MSPHRTNHRPILGGDHYIGLCNGDGSIQESLGTFRAKSVQSGEKGILRSRPAPGRFETYLYAPVSQASGGVPVGAGFKPALMDLNPASNITL